MFFIAYVDANPLVPLDTSPADGSTAIPEPAFKNLLTALVKGDVAGADTMAGQLTSDQVNAIQYAAKAMGVYLGIDLGYQHPRGLFAVGDHLVRALDAVVQKNSAKATKSCGPALYSSCASRASATRFWSRSMRSQDLCPRSLATRPCSTTCTRCTARTLHRSRSRLLLPIVESKAAGNKV